MKKIVKLNEVFARYAGVLHMRAEMGLPYSALVCDEDKQDVPQCFETFKQADSLVVSLNRQGITASVCQTIPYSKNPETGYRLYIKPDHGFGSFDRM